MRRKIPFELQKNAMQGIEEAVFWHTVGIVADSGTSVGTATAIRWRYRSLLVTANHVIDQSRNDDLRFIFRPSGTLERASECERGGVTKTSRFPASPLQILQRYQDAEDDIAALEVSSTLDQEKNVTFFDIKEEAKLPARLPSSLAAIGFPADSIEQLGPAAKAIQAFTLWGNPMGPGKKQPTGYKRGRHILLDFPAAQDGRHPGGFSGAGAWYCDSPPKQRIWFPDLRLAGICTHYYPRRQSVLICRVEKIASFLKCALTS